ncbi:hypothetical protein GGI20_005373 [Coemansia sp. BCRC 34301]|nr:hypothetical protein GGI20_005373 [Coemansia sp. BCRC 34301]
MTPDEASNCGAADLAAREGAAEHHHRHLTASHRPSEAGARTFVQQTQSSSQSLHTSLPATQSGPGFTPTLIPADTSASTADLADGLQLATLATPTTISPLHINDQTSAAVASATASSHGQPMQPTATTAPIYMHGLPGTLPLAQPAAPSMAPTHSASMTGTATPMLGPDSQMVAHHIDAAAIVAHINAQSHLQQQYMSINRHGLSSEQGVASSIMQPMINSLPVTAALAPSLPSQVGSLNLPTGSPTNSGLGPMSTLSSTAGLQPMSSQQPIGNPGDLLAQQQAAYAVAMGASMYGGGGAQFGASMSHAHSRTTSIADGAVAANSNGDSNSGTPQSGIVASASNMGTQPIATQLQHQLQQQLFNHHHQQQQSQLNGLSSNASAVPSANQSGAPSPFATTPLPTANQGNPAAPIGHQRQQSSAFLAVMQQQQQQQAMFADPPMALATAPATLVPGTPTPFGQLQFHMHSLGTVTAPQPLNHPHASHFGHSRHLSLDAANLRLMAVDTPSMAGFPVHETIHEYSADMAQHAVHFGSVHHASTAQQQLQQQQLQQQQLQQQLQHLQQMQMQAQQKLSSAAIRTLPATPLPHQPANAASFNSAPQLTPLSDAMAQSHFQQLQPRNQQQRQQMFMHHHHSSASVDLGSLSSAFHHPAQYGQALSGHISPMAVAHPNMPTGGSMSQVYLPMQFAQLAPQPRSQHASNTGGNSTAAASPEVSDDDVDDMDDEDISGEDADVEGRKLVGAKHGKGTATPTSSVSGAAARSTRAPAQYKRFRNSFIFFANERRKLWKLERPRKSKLQNRGFIQEMSKTWSTMSAEEKAPYVKMADEDKLRYEADVLKYGPLPTSSSSVSLVGLVQDSPTGSGPLSGHSFVSLAAGTSKTKAANTESTAAPMSTAEKARLLSLVPIAPAPAPAPTSTVDTTMAPAVAAGASNVAASAMPTAASMAISTSTPALLPDISVASTGEHVLEAISPIYTSAPHSSLTVQTMQASHDFSSALAMPITPIAGIASSMVCDSHEFDSGFLDQAAYHAYLQQILGQDLSPLAIEFDPSCFVNSDPASSDETTCLNPQALAAVPAETMLATMPEAASQQQQQPPVFVEGSGAKTPSNGPPIMTQVGTKRKSSSDGQPLTNLPSSIKRFRNSFIYYVNKRRRELQGPDDGISVKVEVNNREFLKEMSAKWRTMSEEEKAPFTEMANADKERFLRQMREYELEHPGELSKAPKHRRRRSSTSASNVSISGMNASASESTTKLRDLQQQDAQSAESSSCGLNISMTGSALPFGGYGASVSRDSQWALSTGAPLTVPNMAGDKPGLASVPEEMAICSDSSALYMAHSINSSCAAAGTVAPALLSTVTEEPEESGRT